MSHDQNYQLCLISPGRLDLMSRYVSGFLRSKEAAGRAQGTIVFYRRALLEFARFVPAWPPIGRDLEAYLLYRRRKVSDVSVNSNWRAVVTFLNWCEQRRLLEDNPLRYVDKPRNLRPLPKAAPKGTIRRLFAAIERAVDREESQAIRDLAMFRLCYCTGMRCSELAHLQIDDLDLDYNVVMIRQGKGSKDRAAYYVNKCIPALRAWLQIHPGGQWLFVSRIRTEVRPLTRGGVYSALQRWCKAAEVHLSVHQLRHSYATHALRDGNGDLPGIE